MMKDCKIRVYYTRNYRRLYGDLIEMLKIFKGFDVINYKKFSLSSTELMGHDFKLPVYKPQVNQDVRNYFFSNRVIK